MLFYSLLGLFLSCFDDFVLGVVMGENDGVGIFLVVFLGLIERLNEFRLLVVLGIGVGVVVLFICFDVLDEVGFWFVLLKLGNKKLLFLFFFG